MSLRFRLSLIITTLIVLFTLVTGKIVVDDARRSIREEIEAGTKVTLQLLTAILYDSELTQRTDDAEQVLLAFLQHLGRVRANEILLYSEADGLVYSSPPSAYKVGRYAPAWFAGLMKPGMEEVVLKTVHGRVVVVPDASRSILDAWDELSRLFWLAVGFLLVVNLAVFFLLGRSLRPVRTILSGLSQMEQGRFHARLPSFRLPEFNSISRTFNRMATTLEESQEENRRLALVARQSSDAIIIHDLQGNISFCNPAAERLFGFAADEIVGKSAHLLAPPELQAELADNLQAIREGRMVENLETHRLARDGRLVEVALSAAPLVDPVSNEVIGEICAMRDITEHKRAQRAELELEQNRRLTHLIQARLEEERRQIARELHDELGQCVTAIRTIGAAISNRTQTSSPDIYANAQTIVKVAGHLYDVAHGIIRQLRPSALDHLGLEDALEEWVATFRERYPDVRLDLELAGDLSDLGETVNITAYRIIQECLTNVVRHAAATRAQITVRRAASKLEVSVQDNGKGLGERNAMESARFGLMGMRERVQALHGEFSIDSSPGTGMRVRATIPLSEQPSQEAVAAQ